MQQKVSHDTKTCPYCGQTLKAEWSWTLIVLHVALLAGATILYYFAGNKYPKQTAPMQDDPPEYRAKVNLGWVFLALLGVQVLIRLDIHFRNPFDIPVCDRNSLAVDLATDPLIWIWAVLATMRLKQTAPMQDNLPTYEPDEFDGMLDDAPTTATHMPEE